MLALGASDKLPYLFSIANTIVFDVGGGVVVLCLNAPLRLCLPAAV